MNLKLIRPKNWKESTLGKIRGKPLGSIDPVKHPEEKFELYSVPSYLGKIPELSRGKEIGSSKQKVIPNSVLLCKINPRLNRAWVVGNFTDRLKIASSEWIVFQPNTEYAPKFLRYYLLQENLRTYFAQNSSGVGGSLMRIKPSTIEDIPFYFPPYLEQLKIADKIDELLSDLEAGETALSRVKMNLKRYRASVLKAAVEGKLTEKWRKENPDVEPAEQLLQRILIDRRKKWETDQLSSYEAKGKKAPKNWKSRYKEPATSDTSNLPLLPNGWCWASIEQTSSYRQNSITDGPFGSKLKTAYYTNSGVRVVRLGNIKPGVFNDLDKAFISLERFKSLKKYSIKGGNLVVAALAEPVGRCCQIPDRIDQAVVKADCFKFVPHDHFATRYFMHWLNSPTGSKLTENKSHGMGRLRINLSNFRSFPVALPPSNEMLKIASIVDLIFDLIDKQEKIYFQFHQRAEFLRQSILKQGFEGKLV